MVLLRCILDLNITAAIYSTIFLFYTTFVNNNIALGSIQILSPRNISSNSSSHVCSTGSNGDLNNETLHIHGTSSHHCSLQVASNSASSTVLQVVVGNSSESTVVYIQRLQDLMQCENRYVVVNTDDTPCSAVLMHPQLEINVHGNVDVTISEVSAVESSYICPEQIKMEVTTSDINQIPNCSIGGYNSIIKCELRDDHNFLKSSFSDSASVCGVSLPERCTSDLGDREATVHCVNNRSIQQTYKAAIIYPPDLSALDLRFNSIQSIQSNAFHSLPNLRALDITHNNLMMLDTGVLENLPDLNYIDLAFNQLVSLGIDLFQDLPNLVYLDIDYNNLVELPVGLFRRLYILNQLDLQFNKLISLKSGLFKDLRNLTYIDLDNNELVELAPDIFKGLYKLQYLHLDYNKLKSLDAHIFQDLHDLIYLDLKVNQFVTLDPSLLTNLRSLTTLLLGNNQLMMLDSHMFKGLLALAFLDLSDNNLKEIPTISTLQGLHYFRLNDNPLVNVKNESFLGIPKTVEFYVSQPEICMCFIPTDVNCTAAQPRSPYMTCTRLLSDRVLVAFMWIIGLNAIGGNLFVMGWRTKYFQNNRLQSLLLTNLAVSDLLMGLYMMIVACADIYFGEDFPMHAEAWRSSTTCRITGTIAILSSEASVFFVMMISIDRFIDIKYPYSSKKLRQKWTHICIALVWIFSAISGIIPSYFSGQNQDFYDNSHVCIGLPLAQIETYAITTFETEICPANTPFCHTKISTKSHSEGFNSGMYFSMVLFLGINCLCYVVILACYIEIIRCVYKSSKRARLNAKMKEQISLTIKVAVIVATDFFCWFPIIVLGILVQANVLILPPSVFAWSVTVVLPINSAINPYLYTVAVIVSKRRKQNEQSKTQTEGGSVTRAHQFNKQNPQNQPNPQINVAIAAGTNSSSLTLPNVPTDSNI